MDAGKVGRDMELIWRGRKQWIHRRVDTYDFHGEGNLRCESSIDLTVPLEAPKFGADDDFVRLVPLMSVRRGSIQRQFDLCDAHGNSLSRLGQKACNEISYDILLSVAQQVWGSTPPPELPGFFRTLTDRAFPADRSTAQRELGRALEGAALSGGDDRAALRLRYWVSFLAEHSLLIALIPAKPKVRFIAGMRYLEKVEWRHPFSSRLGWEEWSCKVGVPVDEADGYHIEMNVPDGVQLSNMTLQSEDGEVEDKMVLKEATDQIAHLVAHDLPEGSRYFARVSIRATRGGWLTAAVASALAITGLLIFMTSFSPELTRADQTRVHPATDLVFLAATLFLSTGAAVIAVLARASEHALTSALLIYPRVLMSILTVISFSAVLAFVTVRGTNLLWTVFMILIGFAAPLSVGLCATWVRSGRQRP